MAKKRQKPRARRQRPPRPETTAPPWLAQLRAALFGPDFPAVDPHYQAMDGSQFVCERSVDEQGGRLLYRETWKVPVSLARIHGWTQELDYSSFVGTPSYVFARHVATVRQCLQDARPQWPVVRPPRRTTLARCWSLWARCVPWRAVSSCGSVVRTNARCPASTRGSLTLRICWQSW